MSNWIALMIRLIVGLMKTTLHKMSQYFPKLSEALGGDINVKVDLSNYIIKTDSKKATEVDTSNLAAKSDLTDLKAEIGKIDAGKLKTVSLDLSRLSNLINNEIEIFKLLK